MRAISGTFHIVGKSPPRVDGREKVTGRAQYTGDLSLPGMLHGRVLRSWYPHARIRSIDVSAAVALPGVAAVLTGTDLAGLKPYFGHAVADMPVLAIDKVRFVGEPVAAVAAENAYIAADALALIKVEYEELPAATDIGAALAPDAPLLHEQPGIARPPFRGRSGGFPGGNVCYRHEEQKGDVEAVLARADHIFTDSFTFPSVYHYAMEPHSAVAEFRSGRLTVWSCAQHPFLVRNDLAEIFGLPLGLVRVVVPYLGGGFGSKSYTKIEPLVAALARKAGRPVKLCLSVEEAMHTNRRHAAQITITTGVRADGTLLARKAALDLDTGAYADNGPSVVAAAAVRAIGPYRLEAFHAASTAVYTNRPPAGSMRAIGAAQANWAGESQIDMIASRLGLDPVEVRRKSLAQRGEVFVPNHKPMDCDLPADLDRLVAAMEADTPLPPPGKGKARGRGLAIGVGGGGASPVSVALLKLHHDGHVSVLAGSSELGQGARTVLSQIAAEELGLPLSAITYMGSDTTYTPYDRSTGASRSTTVAGTAIQLAARDLREQLVAVAAAALKVPASELQYAGGRVLGPGGAAMTLADLVRAHFGMSGGELVGRGYCGPTTTPQLCSKPMFWESALGAAEITVDRETGEISIDRFTCLSDVGRAIHPLMLEGQDQGAVAQGIGHTLFEELQFDGGQIVNANLADYRVPLAADMPPVWHSIVVEDGLGPGPYGAKGAGETPVVMVAPAVASALEDATGVRITDLPLTPERVWRALRSRSGV